MCLLYSIVTSISYYQKKRKNLHTCSCVQGPTTLQMKVKLYQLSCDEHHTIKIMTLQKRPFSTCSMESHVHVVTCTCMIVIQVATRLRKTPGHGSLLYVTPVISGGVFSFLTTFSTSLEGSVIKPRCTYAVRAYST